MFHDHWTDHFDRAFEIEEEERTDFFEDEAMHDLFADELWISKFDETTKRRILAKLLEVGVRATMKNSLYQFGGKNYK